MRIPEGRQESRLRVTKIKLALLEASEGVCKELNWEVTFAELHLAMADVQAHWADQELRMDTPGEDDFAHIGEDKARQIFEAGVDAARPISDDDGPGRDFDSWWEQVTQ